MMISDGVDCFDGVDCISLGELLDSPWILVDPSQCRSVGMSVGQRYLQDLYRLCLDHGDGSHEIIAQCVEMGGVVSEDLLNLIANETLTDIDGYYHTEDRAEINRLCGFM